MAEFSRVLLLADFDRTLTDTNSLIPERNLEAIRSFTARGGAFTVASGRSIPMFRARAAEIPYNVPLILFNGAALYDYRTEQLEDAFFMPEGRALTAWLAAEFPDLNLDIEGIHRHYLLGENPLRDDFFRVNHTEFVHITLDALPERIIKVALLGSFRDLTVRQFYSDEKPEEIRRFDELVARICAEWPNLATARSAHRILDIQNRSASKGTAARRLAGRLSRDLLVCVGDARNDLSMLREADLAYAPGDCEQAILDAGIPTVCPCDEGSVADVIELLEQI